MCPYLESPELATNPLIDIALTRRVTIHLPRTQVLGIVPLHEC